MAELEKLDATERLRLAYDLLDSVAQSEVARSSPKPSDGNCAAGWRIIEATLTKP